MNILCPKCGDFFELYEDEEIAKCRCGNKVGFIEVGEEETDRLLNEIDTLNSKEKKDFLINYAKEQNGNPK